jgi:hypothetical protein
MVRPIDLQDNLSKTQAAERMNQIQKAHGEMGQRQVADALKEKTSADMEKTKASEKTDMVIIRKEKNKDNPDQKGQKDKKNDREQSEGESTDHLDLKG